MEKQILKEKYNPQNFEEELYKKWEKSGYFKPNMDKTKESFCIMMPPPNVTGKLHMGHALDGTIQDILIRYKRMKGYNTLWIPRKEASHLWYLRYKIKDEDRYIVNREISIIADEFVEREFRTGCVNVTLFETQLLKHLKLEMLVERITNYFNENRREIVGC